MIPDYFTFDYTMFSIFGFIMLTSFSYVFLWPVISVTVMNDCSESCKTKFFITCAVVFLASLGLCLYFGDRDAKSHSSKPTVNTRG